MSRSLATQLSKNLYVIIILSFENTPDIVFRVGGIKCLGFVESSKHLVLRAL